MALSRKHSGKQIVPWYSRDEWLDVYDKLYGPKCNETTKKQGLDILHIWESRTKYLPSGVIGTIIILDAHCHYVCNYKNRDLQMLVSAVILRFLNVCVANDDKLGTFYIMAKKMNVPRWMISLRHDIAHGQTVPPIELLMSALSFSVNWLHMKYWQPVRQELKDFVVTKDWNASSAARLAADLEPLVNYYGYLCLGMHEFWSYMRVSDIKDQCSRDNLLSFLQDTRGHEVNQNTDIKRVLKLIWGDVQDVMFVSDVPNRGAILVDVLLAGDCFLCDIPNYHDIFEEKQPTRLPCAFVAVWGLLVRHLQRTGCLPALVEKLVGVVKDEADSRIRRLTGALWLAEIGNALSKAFTESREVLKEQKKRTAEERAMSLNLFWDLPHVFQDWPRFQALVLDSPNELLLLCLPALLRAHQSLKSEAMVQQILAVTRLYVAGRSRGSRAPPPRDFDVYVVRGPDQEAEDARVAGAGDRTVTVEEPAPRKFSRVTDVAGLAQCALGVLPCQRSASSGGAERSSLIGKLP